MMEKVFSATDLIKSMTEKLKSATDLINFVTDGHQKLTTKTKSITEKEPSKANLMENKGFFIPDYDRRGEEVDR